LIPTAAWSSEELEGPEDGARLPVGIDRSLATKANDPTQGRLEQAIGFYTEGRLSKSSRFDLEGDGFVKIFRPRDRGWATYDFVYVIQTAAAAVKRFFPAGERLQVGDVTSEKGGQLSGHASHQSGLDGDVSFFRLSYQEQSADEWGEHGFDESFVHNGKISRNFDLERNWAFVKALTSTSRVTRIFVDSVIKKALCNYALKVGEYSETSEPLRRLRAYPNHDDHFHIRISCPGKSPRCKGQEEPPVGSGCLAVVNDLDMTASHQRPPRRGSRRRPPAPVGVAIPRPFAP